MIGNEVDNFLLFWKILCVLKKNMDLVSLQTSILCIGGGEITAGGSVAVAVGIGDHL